MTQNEAGSVVKVGVLGCGNVGAALVALVEARGSEIAARTGVTLEVAKVDGGPVRESPHADALRAAGFGDGYKGLVLRSR